MKVAKDITNKVLTSQRFHAMSRPGEATVEENVEENIEFSWGHKKGIGGPNKDVQFYESFKYDGVEYFLYDCVYIWGENMPNPSIGKVIRMCETSRHKKFVKIVWFFQPIEIQYWLQDVVPLKNEIFLASGEGKGLFNLNPPEAIVGKCNVVCTSKDNRNPQASEEELLMADYIFYRTFDVGSCTISHSFVDVIAGINVKHFFNKEKGQKLITMEHGANLNEKSRCSSSFLKVEGVTAVRNPVKDGKTDIGAKPTAAKVSAELKIPAAMRNPVKDERTDISAKPAAKELKIPAASLSKQSRFRDENIVARPKTFIGKVGAGDAQVADKAEMQHSDNLSTTNLSDISPLKKRKVQCIVGLKDDPAKLSDTLPRLPDIRVKSVDAVDPVIKNSELSKGVNFHEKARKISDTSVAQHEQDKGIKTDSQILEVTRKPGEDTSKWFKQQPWEERMQRAYEKGTLVFLENLDPSYTSSEVEDLVWHAFKANVNAKMVQCSSFSSPHYGQAIVIFKSKDAAELALTELNRKCLMLTNGRAVVGRKGSPKKPSDQTRFVGHLIIGKFKFYKQREEMKNAVSTSHYSQPNTIEYDMALKWRVLQAKSNLWWDALNEQQAKEIEDLRSQLSMSHDDLFCADDIWGYRF
ncbi:protein ANTI-SILENCING 1-like isoform X3 [Camellia sinensis]|uniref:protein ANTI-SILENCING 1-like isoform X3 n=1 Tax=Camellia sinensis TaxID=4442 RepID=UPI001035FB2E|nr:protein ANTI-SILENCING 1-like isoform X3 [Camellia sinensis]